MPRQPWIGCCRRCGRNIENRIYGRSETMPGPHLIDLEVTQGLGRLLREYGKVSANRATQVIDDLLDLRMVRYSHAVLLPQVWQYRHNLSAYAAAYIALAENLGAPLLTRDARLASASGHRAIVELF